MRKRFVLASLALAVVCFSGCNASSSADGGGLEDAASSYDLTGGNDLSTTADLGMAAACTKAGGTVEMAICCQLTGDFPNLCDIGPCGCGPGSSHEVQACICPNHTCWNGTDCAAQ